MIEGILLMADLEGQGFLACQGWVAGPYQVVYRDIWG